VQLSVSHEVVAITRAQVDEFCGNVLEVKGTGGKRVLAMSSRAFAAFTDAQKAVRVGSSTHYLALSHAHPMVFDRCYGSTRTSWCTPLSQSLRTWAAVAYAA
jgi:hypothetical protein